MSSTSPTDPRARAIWRWGGAIAALLVVQSIILAGLFWLLAAHSHEREAEHGFARDCETFAALASPLRPATLRAMLTRDIHRDRFLAIFAADGSPIEGNVARLPHPATTGTKSFVAPIRATELPGKTHDVARLALCTLPDGEKLLTGVDLDDSEEALRVVRQSLLFALGPGILIALAFGLFAGRRAARQVDAIRRLTARIMSGSLEDRLPVSDRPDSFEQLCAHINAMLDRLQALVLDMRAVGDDIAHQLRTPLTRLRARLERSLRDTHDRAGFETAAIDALGEIDKLLGVVAAMLRIRELEDHARRSRFAPVDLAKIAADACELHRPIAEDRGIDLVCTIAPLPPFDGDDSLLIEALSNLIDNAMKFGPANGRVAVDLRRDGHHAVLSVTDDGAGVPVSDRLLVTQRFYRGSHEVDGVGLGLSLVKAIAELHGCTLAFASDRSCVSLVFASDRDNDKRPRH